MGLCHSSLEIKINNGKSSFCQVCKKETYNNPYIQEKRYILKKDIIYLFNECCNCGSIKRKLSFTTKEHYTPKN